MGQGSIITNSNAAFANSQLYQTGVDAARVSRRIASGFRINDASDDAAGLAIAEKTKSLINGTQQGIKNASNFISALKIVSSTADSIVEALQRMRELAVQAKNGTNSSSELTTLDAEFQQGMNSIVQLAGAAKINGIGLTDGTNSTLTAQTGDANASSDTISLNFSSFNLTTSGLNSVCTASIATSVAAAASITLIDSAISTLNNARALAGAYLNRLTALNKANTAKTTALQDVLGDYMDANIPEEYARSVSLQIRTQAQQSLLTQSVREKQSMLAFFQ